MATSAKPSLRFFHSAALRTRTNKLLTAIEQDQDATPHAAALAVLVADLTEAGLDYYYLRPLKLAKCGFVARQSASFGMTGVLRLMSPVVRSILASSNTAQLRQIARHIRELM